jgi:predicted PurR-regulated permease PerM
MAARKEEEKVGAKVIAVSTGTILRTLAVILALYVLYLIRDIVGLFLVAVFISVLVDPLADKLQRAGLPRGFAVALIYLVGVACLVGILILIIPPLLTEFSQVMTTFAPFIEHSPFGGLVSLIDSGPLSQGLGTLATTIQQTGIMNALPQVAPLITGAFGSILGFLVILVLAYYMVSQENILRRGLMQLAPAEYQPFVGQLFVKVRDKLGFWLRGQLLLMLSIGVLDFIVLSVLGIPYALVLAIFAALVEIIPFIGPNVAVLPAIIIAFSVSPVHAILVGAAYFVIQQIESNFLTPKIMQRATGLNPIVTIVAIMIGFELGSTLGIQGSIVGALLAIPVAMMCSVFFNEIFRQPTISE